MSEPLLTPADLQQAGEKIRADVLANYDASGITNRSGTLRDAIANAAIAVTADSVTATLADVARPARGNETRPPTTRYYGPLVFAGRPMRISAVRRVTRGRSVATQGAGAGVAVFVLGESQTEEVKADIAAQVAESAARLLKRG